MEEKNCCDCKFYDGCCCMYECRCKAILNELKTGKSCPHFQKGKYDEDELERSNYQ